MNNKLNTVKRIGTALAFFLYPLFAGFAFAAHPNLLSLAISHDPLEKIAEFHGNSLLHFGHFLMTLAAPLLIVVAVHFMRKLENENRSAWWGFIGGCMAVFGAVILALDKAALCLVPSAFDTLPEAAFQALTPGIEAMFTYQGWLWLLNLLPLLPLGFIVQSVGLVRSGQIARSVSVPILIGSILMANPDIDIIGLVATVVLAIGFWPYALGLLKNQE